MKNVSCVLLVSMMLACVGKEAPVEESTPEGVAANETADAGAPLYALEPICYIENAVSPMDHSCATVRGLFQVATEYGPCFGCNVWGPVYTCVSVDQQIFVAGPYYTVEHHWTDFETTLGCRGCDGQTETLQYYQPGYCFEYED